MSTKSRVHVEVTIKGPDSMIIRREHFATWDAAVSYEYDVKAHHTGWYDATVTECTQPHCPDVDVTKEV